MIFLNPRVCYINNSTGVYYIITIAIPLHYAIIFRQVIRLHFCFVKSILSICIYIPIPMMNISIAINTVGKCVKELKAVLYCAETEGSHSNGKYSIQDHRQIQIF